MRHDEALPWTQDEIAQLREAALMYRPDGTVISIEEAVNPADLPAPVKVAFKKLYPTATITLAERVKEDGKTT
jgi:hypothetical protein